MILTHFLRGIENDDGYMRRDFLHYITSDSAAAAPRARVPHDGHSTVHMC